MVGVKKLSFMHESSAAVQVFFPLTKFQQNMKFSQKNWHWWEPTLMKKFKLLEF
jgi:hypothetical protein